MRGLGAAEKNAHLSDGGERFLGAIPPPIGAVAAAGWSGGGEDWGLLLERKRGCAQKAARNFATLSENLVLQSG